MNSATHRVNRSTSTNRQIVFSKNVQPLIKINLARQFNMLPNSSLGRYLAVFLSSFYPTKNDLSSILTETEHRIDLWESRFLSKAGIFILIQQNLESIPPYTCASTLLPSNSAKSMDLIHRKFFWRQNKEKNGIPLIAWDKLRTPNPKEGWASGQHYK